MLDKNIDPCTDFYAYACRSGRRRTRFQATGRLGDDLTNCRSAANSSCAAFWRNTPRTTPKRSAIEQKIGDYYASCMDEGAIEKAGTKPLQPTLDASRR